MGDKRKIRVLTLCSGYDSQFLACKRLMGEYPGAIEFDLVGWAEIDTWAIKAHDLIFPEYSDRNFGDISKADWSSLMGGVDLMTYSTPCQSISTAGKQEGITEGSGTESALLWEVKRAIRELHLKYLLQENVKALVSQKFMPEFVKWQQFLETEGYVNYWQVLNSKNYCVPQNRERVFMVSIRKDPGEAVPYYEFPEPMPLEKRLKDVLEKEVDESYYLRPEQVERIVEHCDRKVAEGCGFKTNFQTPEGVSGAIKTTEGHREYDTYIKENIVVVDYSSYTEYPIEMKQTSVSSDYTHHYDASFGGATLGDLLKSLPALGTPHYEVECDITIKTDAGRIEVRYDKGVATSDYDSVELAALPVPNVFKLSGCYGQWYIVLVLEDKGNIYLPEAQYPSFNRYIDYYKSHRDPVTCAQRGREPYQMSLFD